MANKKFLDLSDGLLRSLEDGTFRPRVLVVKPYPGYGIREVLTVNMADSEAVARVEKQYGIRISD